jgi:Holliday junction resolvase RusA-like endonuclease
VSDLEFFIPGPPVTWKRSNGTARRFTEAKDRAYRKHVQACAMFALMRVSWFPHDARYSVIIQVKQATRGDADLSNFAKSVEDALNGVVWNDDSQIDRLLVERMWEGPVGTRVIVEVIALCKPKKETTCKKT